MATTKSAPTIEKFGLQTGTERTIFLKLNVLARPLSRDSYCSPPITPSKRKPRTT